MQGVEEAKRILERIYGKERGSRALKRIQVLIENFPAKKGRKTGYFSQSDVVLITYGDTLNRPGETPLNTLYDFAQKYLKDSISTIHFLPFFPFSSDDGFSVMDFFSINPELGSWQEVGKFEQNFQLMFDFVINHFSAKSEWFQSYLEGKTGYEEFAIALDPSIDLSLVTRPTK